MSTPRKLTIVFLVLPFVFCLSFSGVFAQQGCTVSTITGNVQYPCIEIGLGGADTVDAGNNWVGTIDSGSPGVTCSVSSNSGCSIGCSVSVDGSSVTVPVASNQCGSFTVTLTKAASGGCPESSASKDVRITGQGGRWELCSSGGEGIFCNGPWCGGEDDIEGKMKYVVWCKAGGMCLRRTWYDTTDCNGNPAKRIYCPEYCAEGTQGCPGSYNYCSWGVYEWNCPSCP